jgi:two-component system response regulator AtoC
LYYRLNVINIEIPALRQRKDEILSLAGHFLQKHADDATAIPEISPTLKQTLLGHDWPGNIRELENVMRKLLVLRDCDKVSTELWHTRRKVAVARPQQASPESAPMIALPPASNSGPTERPREYGETLQLLPPTEQTATPLEAASESAQALARVDQAKRSAEASVILSALGKTRWNRRQAADLLKIDYKALLYKMKKLQISA